jgi:hypothetical protein
VGADTKSHASCNFSFDGARESRLLPAICNRGMSANLASKVSNGHAAGGCLGPLAVNPKE